MFPESPKNFLVLDIFVNLKPTDSLPIAWVPPLIVTSEVVTSNPTLLSLTDILPDEVNVPFAI